MLYIIPSYLKKLAFTSEIWIFGNNVILSKNYSSYRMEKKKHKQNKNINNKKKKTSSKSCF